jgi:hypothetical protein
MFLLKLGQGIKGFHWEREERKRKKEKGRKKKEEGKRKKEKGEKKD